MTRVEFHLTNQSRSFDQKLIGWFKAQLQDAAVAFQSLRLMSLVPAPAEAAVETETNKPS